MRLGRRAVLVTSPAGTRIKSKSVLSTHNALFSQICSALNSHCRPTKARTRLKRPSPSSQKTASSVQDVAQIFLNILAGRQLVSDAPEFETRWLARLLHARGYSEIPAIEHYDRISFALYSGYALDMVYETVERGAAPHRAGPDSARLATGWLKASRHQTPKM